MNYGLIRLEQQAKGFRLAEAGQSQAQAFAVLPGLSHSGTDMGIMRSVAANSDTKHPTVDAVLNCLLVSSDAKYRACRTAFDSLTSKTQTAEHKTADRTLFLFKRQFVTNRYLPLVFGSSTIAHAASRTTTSSSRRGLTTMRTICRPDSSSTVSATAAAWGSSRTTSTTT